MSRDEDNLTSTARVLRFDIIIAVCALLISTLATGAAWWQARVLAAQTHVLEEQLGAQVWPYVSTSVSTSGNAVEIDIANDGLGPAVLRSAVASVDGVPESNFIQIMHALLGANLIARKPRGESINLGISSGTPGTVLRPGVTIHAFTLQSKTYARRFLRAYGRVRTKICYCAIIPGKCWLSDSAAASGDSQPVRACPVIANDLLHSSAVDELLNTKF